MGLALCGPNIPEGANLVVDSRGFKLEGYENGYFLGGCLFDYRPIEAECSRRKIDPPNINWLRRVPPT